jgi:energy-coupling factor transporter ATP-binding protein EcfA2
MIEINSIYDSFNARYLTFQQVADSFIKNDYFEQLRNNNHSLLMGPRGCGKTTLLKMLTPTALHFWDKKQRTNIFSEIPFIAVYIPTDVQWKKQLDQLIKDFPDKHAVESVSRATVNINILISVIQTFSFLLRETEHVLPSFNSTSNESKLCSILIDKWSLTKPIIPDLDSIEISLLGEIAFINSEIRKKKVNLGYTIPEHKMFNFHYFDLVNIAFTAFEKIFNVAGKKNWALCFDELEIAPEWLQFELFQSLRSRDQKIIFKLTTAPIISLVKRIDGELPALNASEKNDYSIIKIWTSNQKDFKIWTEFSDQLIRSRMSRKFNKSIASETLLGVSQLDRLIEESFKFKKMSKNKMSFEKDTPTWHIIRELAMNDFSFLRFLITKDIDANNPVPRNTKEKDEIFRKIKQIVVFRFQFLRERTKEGVVKRRARKLVPLYFGIPLIYELSDGNPRILIGMLDDLLNLASIANGEFRELKISEQSRIISEISQKFLSVTASHPDANVLIKNKVINIADILIEIGTYFHEKLVFDEFTMDPPGSFRVDDSINNKFQELIELALYLGAIVSLDNEDPFSKNGVIGQRFRLSYILAPYFNLLSRDYKEVQLSKILAKEPNSQFQQTLFNI